MAAAVGWRRHAGFTLIELLLVITLIAVASGVAALAMRDPAASQLEQEAARLTALLEAARTQARGAGLEVSWQPTAADNDGNPAGFRFIGLPPGQRMPTQWLGRGVSAAVAGGGGVLLGPEPIIGAQAIYLSLESQRLTLLTDGLGPFLVTSADVTVTR